MIDLGLFNFVKNAVAQGQTKETITKNLTGAGWNQENIDEAYADVVNNTPPVVAVHTENIASTASIPIVAADTNRPIMITALCSYYFISTAFSAITLALLAVNGIVQSSGPSSTNFNLPNLGGTLLTLWSFVGIWRMRKWGVYLYTVTTIISIGILLYINLIAKSPMVISFLLMLPFPIFAMWVGFKYLDQMS